MIYIYNCYGGTHSSSLASAVHLKKLPEDRIPEREEILGIEYFNKLTYKDMGRLIFRGIDDEGNRVYSIGRGTSKVIVPCLRNFIDMISREYEFREKVVLSNMSPTVPPAMTMGGFFSRGLGIDSIGVPLLVVGAKQAFGHVVEIVRYTKQRAKESNEAVLVLENSRKQ